MVIGAHQAGLIRLIGIDDDDGGANGYNSVGWFRQMLDQAGLADVPIGVGANSPTSNLGGCPAANITAYNANTPQNASSYESALTMYRTLFAKYSSTPIYVLMTQTATVTTASRLSPADSISSLTGLQLQAQNYANGGWVNAFEGNFANTPPYYLSVLNNMGTSNDLPIYLEGGTPAQGGPGTYASRTALDPLYLAAMEMGVGGCGVRLDKSESCPVTDAVFLGRRRDYRQRRNRICSLNSIHIARRWSILQRHGFDAVQQWRPKCNDDLLGLRSSLYLRRDRLWVHTGCVHGDRERDKSHSLGRHSGTITIGDTIAGAGIPTGTRIVSQTSGTTGGIGVYVTSVATAASAATVTRTPTIVLTAPHRHRRNVHCI